MQRCGMAVLAVRDGSSATKIAFFNAKTGRGGNFATILALFGAELLPRCGFATKMAFFDAETVRDGNFAMISALFDAESLLLSKPYPT